MKKIFFLMIVSIFVLTSSCNKKNRAANEVVTVEYGPVKVKNEYQEGVLLTSSHTRYLEADIFYQANLAAIQKVYEVRQEIKRGPDNGIFIPLGDMVLNVIRYGDGSNYTP